MRAKQWLRFETIESFFLDTRQMGYKNEKYNIV